MHPESQITHFEIVFEQHHSLIVGVSNSWLNDSEKVTLPGSHPVDRLCHY